MLNPKLIALLKKTKNHELLSQYEMGKLTEFQVLRELAKLIKNPHAQSVLNTMINLAENNTSTPEGKPKVKKDVFISKVEMLEALKHGISSETYMFNKHLSLEEKLRLPDAWQVIFALNYKEKKHGKGKRKVRKGL